MRGLVQFIADLRNARARELEEKRINKELANIRYVWRPLGALPERMLIIGVCLGKNSKVRRPRTCPKPDSTLTLPCRWQPERLSQEKIRLQSGCDLALWGGDVALTWHQLLYIYILGWNVDFGHLEAVNLISATKYSEKQIGYLAMTLFLHEKHELLHLVVNSIRKDLLDHNELFNCLALHAIANVGGREMGEALSGEVHRLLISPYVRTLAMGSADRG